MDNADDDGEQLRRYQAEVNDHPASRAYGNWDAFRRVHTVFRLNERDLLDVLNQPANDVQLALELVQNARPPTIREDFYNEMYRWLHNYLASAATLVDHTRNLVNGYAGSPFAVEYEMRKNVLIDKPVVDFVKRLRNYLLHSQLPVVRSSMSMDFVRSAFTSGISAYTSHLLMWEEWTAGSRTYIESKGKHLALVDPVMEYSAELKPLYQWIYAQFEVLHGEEVKALNALVEGWKGG